jgi:hypothetical protein
VVQLPELLDLAQVAPQGLYSFLLLLHLSSQVGLFALCPLRLLLHLRQLFLQNNDSSAVNLRELLPTARLSLASLAFLAVLNGKLLDEANLLAKNVHLLQQLVCLGLRLEVKVLQPLRLRIELSQPLLYLAKLIPQLLVSHLRLVHLLL